MLLCEHGDNLVEDLDLLRQLLVAVLLLRVRVRLLLGRRRVLRGEGLVLRILVLLALPLLLLILLLISALLVAGGVGILLFLLTLEERVCVVLRGGAWGGERDWREGWKCVCCVGGTDLILVITRVRTEGGDEWKVDECEGKG